MSQLNFHNTSFQLTPQRLLTDLPILTKLSECYKLWHDFLTALPRLTRYTLGIKIDNIYRMFELSILPDIPRSEKLSTVQN